MGRFTCFSHNLMFVWLALSAVFIILSFVHCDIAEQTVPIPSTAAADSDKSIFTDSNATVPNQLPLSDAAGVINKWKFVDTFFGPASVCCVLGLILAGLVFMLAHLLRSDIGQDIDTKLKTAVDICAKRNFQEAQLCRTALAYVLGGPAAAAAATASMSEPLNAGRQQSSNTMPEKAVPPPNSTTGLNSHVPPPPLSVIPPFSGGAKSSFAMPPPSSAPPVDAGEIKRLKERCAELERQSEHYKDTVDRMLRQSEEREAQLRGSKNAEQAREDEMRAMERRYTMECDKSSTVILELEDIRQRLSEKEAENKELMENLSTFRTDKDAFLRLNEDTAVQALREHTSKNLDELRQMLEKTSAELKQSQSETFTLQHEKLLLDDKLKNLERELAENSSSTASGWEKSDEIEQQVQQLSTDLRVAHLEKERLEREAATLKDRLSAVQKQFELAKLLQFSESRLHEVEKFKIELRESLLDEVRVNHEREVDQYKYTSEALKDELRDKNRAYQDSTRALRMQCERRDIDLMNCQNLIEDLRAKIQSVQADNKNLRAASGKPDADENSFGRNDANVPVVFGGPHAHTFDLFHSRVSGGAGAGFDFTSAGTGSPGSAFSANDPSQQQMYQAYAAAVPPMYNQQFSFVQAQQGMYGAGYLSSPAGSAADEFRSKRTSKHQQPQTQQSQHHQSSRRRHVEPERHEKRTPEQQQRTSKRSSHRLAKPDDSFAAEAQTGFTEEEEGRDTGADSTERNTNVCDDDDAGGATAKAVPSNKVVQSEKHSSVRRRAVKAGDEKDSQVRGATEKPSSTASNTAASSKSFGIRPLRR